MLTIPAELVEPRLRFEQLALAIEQGHRLPQATLNDSFLRRGNDTLLLRSAWIDGLGMAVKAATIFPDNGLSELPTVQGTMTLYHDKTGSPEALLDFDQVTRFKTVGDSYLATKRLARADTRKILMVGAGRIAKMVLTAYQQLFPDAQIEIWNHREQTAVGLARQFVNASAVTDLASAVKRADLIACATLSQTPLILGQWLQAGQHIDLIGAFRPDMREADDDVLRRGRIFVDSRQTTLAHIGELAIPLAHRVITEQDIIADFYDLDAGKFKRQSPDDITVFKNGGGAHLDLMTARYILQCAN